VPTSCGIRALEQCFINCDAFKPLRRWAETHMTPFIEPCSARLQEALVASGASDQLDAAATLKALRSLAAVPGLEYVGAEAVRKIELVRFLYATLAEDVLVDGGLGGSALKRCQIKDAEDDASICPALSGLSAEPLVLAPIAGSNSSSSSSSSSSSGNRVKFCKVAECIWDGSAELAALLGAPGPLSSLYGDDAHLTSLFCGSLHVQCCGFAQCAQALRCITGTEPLHQGSSEAWQTTKDSTTAVLNQLELLMADCDDSTATLEEHDWPLLCQKGTQLRFKSAGPQSSQQVDIFVRDRPATEELFLHDVWLLEKPPFGPAQKFLTALRSPNMQYRLWSLAACHREEVVTFNRFGQQPKYLAAARLALSAVAFGVEHRLASVEGCGRALRCTSLHTGGDQDHFSSVDVQRSQLIHHIIEKTTDGRVDIVLVKFTEVLGVSGLGGPVTPQPQQHTRCLLPGELRDELAVGLAAAFGLVESSPQLRDALRELLPNPPPLQEPQAEPCSRPPTALQINATAPPQASEELPGLSALREARNGNLPQPLASSLELPAPDTEALGILDTLEQCLMVLRRSMQDGNLLSDTEKEIKERLRLIADSMPSSNNSLDLP